MFEETCLTCGSHLADDGRAYCSDECQLLDTSSPSLSSASSAFSSPQLPYAHGCDVPLLVPSMLGSALKNYHDRQSASSSSASSTAWSVETDDEDQDDLFLGATSDPDTSDSTSEQPTKPTSYALCSRPLVYARRPSGTNTRSTVPHLHRRTPSGSYVRGTRSPRSHAHDGLITDRDDEDFSEHIIPQSAPERPGHNFVDSTITTSKRSRNRASLPAYFTLLQLGNGQPETSRKGSPTVSTSSDQTIIRPSPPTPKLALSAVVFRGRKDSKSSLTSSTSSTRSKSDSHALDYGMMRSPPRDPFLLRPRLDSHSTQVAFEQPSDHRRGRAAVRRNSSPLPNASAPVDDEYAFGHGDDKPRGRARVEELDGLGCSQDAPGFGHGRSGLMHREKSSRGIGRFR